VGLQVGAVGFRTDDTSYEEISPLALTSGTVKTQNSHLDGIFTANKMTTQLHGDLL
jgi:hypothetical protein